MSSISPESTRARWFKRACAPWIAAAVLIFWAPGVGPWAGSEKIIEERTREMEDLNKRAVEQVPYLPRDGKVRIEADGAYRDGEIRFHIREHSTTGVIKEGEVLDKETQTGGQTGTKTGAPTDETIQFKKNNNQTTQTEGRDGENDPEKN
ncbi:MAG: hypothetical protein GY859_11300 [Desulfobacterales bacterium]|nr:hypothetical protein [Desulfobacterales bacterium]